MIWIHERSFVLDFAGYIFKPRKRFPLNLLLLIFGVPEDEVLLSILLDLSHIVAVILRFNLIGGYRRPIDLSVLPIETIVFEEVHQKDQQQHQEIHNCHHKGNHKHTVLKQLIAWLPGQESSCVIQHSAQQRQEVRQKTDVCDPLYQSRSWHRRQALTDHRNQRYVGNHHRWNAQQSISQSCEPRSIANAVGLVEDEQTEGREEEERHEDD